jgi:hypothetical protein
MSNACVVEESGGACGGPWYVHLLEDGLRSLDPMARTVFVLRNVEQIPVERIAEIVRIVPLQPLRFAS